MEGGGHLRRSPEQGGTSEEMGWKRPLQGAELKGKWAGYPEDRDRASGMGRSSRGKKLEDRL